MKDEVKILFIVEGSRTDAALMRHILTLYRITENYSIYSYDTNIHHFFRLIDSYEDWESMDLLQALKEAEKDEKRLELLNGKYTDILLIFDMDPQDPDFSGENLKKMMGYFKESTDMGKLYINYPMVESFYHMSTIPDSNYNTYTASIDELKARKYKERVNRENRDHAYNKFAMSREECSIVIKQNIEKGMLLCGDSSNELQIPDSNTILNYQLTMLRKINRVYVLCTAVYFVGEYNMKLLNGN